MKIKADALKMEPVKKKKLIIAFVILLAVAAGIFYFLTTGNIGAKYNTVKVEAGQLEKFVEEIGVISSKDARSYYGNGMSRVKKVNVELGDYVKKGQLLIEFESNTSDSIDSAQTKIASARSSVDFAIKNKNIIEELYENGAASENELRQAEYNVEQRQAEMNTLILSLQTIEENSVIYADFDGVITELNTFEGDTPSAGLMLLEMMDPLKKMLVVDFMVADSLLIEPGMKAEVNDVDLGIRIDDITVQKVYPKSFTVYSELGVEENRQRVEINLLESNQALPFGLKVQTRVLIEESKKALFVPGDAVYVKDSRKYVEVLEGRNPVEREVVTGIMNNNYIEVKQGLKEGDTVILNYETK